MPPSFFRSVVKDEWDKNRWYTPPEAAYFLGMVTTAPLYRYMKQGFLKGIRRPKSGCMGQWLFFHSDLSDFQLNDPRPLRRKGLTLPETIDKEMQKAEKRAWGYLSRHRYQQFGYWASFWAKLNSMNHRIPLQDHPFTDLAEYAKKKEGGKNRNKARAKGVVSSAGDGALIRDFIDEAEGTLEEGFNAEALIKKGG